MGEYDTALSRVAEYYVERMGQWIPGYEVCTPEVGGSEGLRRRRHLERERGWIFEQRKMSGSNAYEYRLVGFDDHTPA